MTDAASPVTPSAPSCVSLSGATVWYPIRRGVLGRVAGHVRAVDGVDLQVGRGEVLGLVGESGCGKTTLGRAAAGLQPLTRGALAWDGTPVPARPPRALRRRVQMVFQDPNASLNPRLTIGEILTEGPRAHRLPAGRDGGAAAALLADVGLEAAALGRYPFEFSGGQRQRISIARALSVAPDFIVCDEPVSALDVSVQAQVINLLCDLRAKRGLAYLFISHDLGVVNHIADRVAVMYLGRVVEEGPTGRVLAAPCHPYTQALRAAVPEPGRDRPAGAPRLGGEPPSPARIPAGCRFHPRCPRVMPICRREDPAPRQVGESRVYCHLYPPAPEAVSGA